MTPDEARKFAQSLRQQGQMSDKAFKTAMREITKEETKNAKAK